jgi:hypothetical protein
MLFATFALLDAGFDRWSICDPYPLPLVNLICFGPLILATMAWDWWSSGRVQRITICASVFLLAVQEGRHLIGYTSGWQRLACGPRCTRPCFTDMPLADQTRGEHFGKRCERRCSKANMSQIVRYQPDLTC